MELGYFHQLLVLLSYRNRRFVPACLLTVSLSVRNIVLVRAARILSTRVVTYSSSILLLEYSKLSTSGYHFHFRSPFLQLFEFLIKR